MIRVDPSEIEPRVEPGAQALVSIRAIAGRLWKAKKHLAVAEAEAAKFAAEVKMIEEFELPAALREAGVSSVPLDGGWSVEKSKVISGTIRKEDEPAVHAWLAAHGFPIVRKVVTAFFDKGEEKLAAKFIRDLEKRKRPIEHEVEDNIHPATWRAFVRRRIEKEDAGKVPLELRLPRDLIGIFELTRAELVGPKEGK